MGETGGGGKTGSKRIHTAGGPDGGRRGGRGRHGSLGGVRPDRAAGLPGWHSAGPTPVEYGRPPPKRGRRTPTNRATGAAVESNFHADS